MVDEGLNRAVASIETGGTVTPDTLKLFLAQVQYAREQGEKRDQRLATAEKEAHESYEKAFKDELTNLLNRRGFSEALETKMERARETPSDKLYAFYVDVDRFKEINDAFGHGTGDKYLKLISRHLMTALRPDDTLGRLGGDEFAALCFIRHQSDEAGGFSYDAIAKQIQERMRQAVYSAKSELLGDDVAELQHTASVGFVQFDGVESANELMDQADNMMYRIKNGGKPPYKPRPS
jgi:diguanylate cyclase (GGDEF)-like protein